MQLKVGDRVVQINRDYRYSRNRWEGTITSIRTDYSDCVYVRFDKYPQRDLDVSIADLKRINKVDYCAKQAKNISRNGYKISF